MRTNHNLQTENVRDICMIESYVASQPSCSEWWGSQSAFYCLVMEGLEKIKKRFRIIGLKGRGLA